MKLPVGSSDSIRRDSIRRVWRAPQVLAAAGALALGAACGGDGGFIPGPGLSACDEDGERPEPGDAPLELGVMRDGSFDPLEDASPMELIRGIQGGWMIQLALRGDVAHLGTAMARQASIAVEVVEEDLCLSYDVDLLFSRSGDTMASDPVLVFLSMELEELEGRDAVVAAMLDGSEAVPAAAVDVVFVDDQED